MNVRHMLTNVIDFVTPSVHASQRASLQSMYHAALLYQGRSLTIYKEIHPIKKKDKPCTHRQFLQALKDIIPTSCKPILATDAGFRCPWFRPILEMVWDYVGRVRHQTQ